MLSFQSSSIPQLLLPLLLLIGAFGLSYPFLSTEKILFSRILQQFGRFHPSQRRFSMSTLSSHEKHSNLESTPVIDESLQLLKENGRKLGYVDVHAHLIHEKFENREDAIAVECIEKGMDFVIVNGIEPISNRKILEFCEKYSPYMQPAIGIYPLDAANQYIYTTEDVKRWQESREEGKEGAEQKDLKVNWTNEFPPPAKFDVDEEIAFIEEMARRKGIIAIGECGLDKHYLTDDVSFAEQERVLRRLMQLGVKYDIPLILHSRKAEKRVFDMLIEEKVKKADFHCFCGKLKLGVQIAEAGYYLSIPSAVANGDPNSSFKKLAAALPLDKVLTETDSPYMGPVKGVDNTPPTVIDSIETIARLKNMNPLDVRAAIRHNFKTLFNL